MHLPYGEKTSGQILSYTIEAIKFLISQNCGLIIIACNTATSIALRYLQQRFIPSFAPDIKVLGVVIPTVEEALSDNASRVGVLATPATVRSHIYQTELHKIKPDLAVFEVAAPKLVPAIESDDFATAKTLAKEYVGQFEHIDSLILGCTHYPLLLDKIKKYLPEGVIPLSQGNLVADSLKDYLHRHPEIEKRCTKNASCRFLTTESPQKFSAAASLFLHEAVDVSRIVLE